MEANSYPSIKKLLEQNYFFDYPELQNTKRSQMGEKLLQIFFMKIQFEDGTKKIARSNGISNFNQLAGFIISQVHISEKQHLKLCLGHLCETNKFEQIGRINSQIMKMFGKKVQQSSEESMSTIADLSSQSFTAPKVETSISSMSQEPPTNFYKYQQSVQEKKQKKLLFENQNTFDTQVSRISHNNSLSKLSLSALTLEFDFLETEQVYETNVDKYLKEKVMSYNSELTLLKQQFQNYFKDASNSEKIGEEIIQKKPYKTHENTLIVTDKLKEHEVFITQKGYGNNKKQAKNDCSLKILRTLYQRFPGLLVNMQQVKAQKNLKA